MFCWACSDERVATVRSTFCGNSMTDRHERILTCPKGLEGLLLEEATALGLEESREQTSAIRGFGTLEVAYRLCLWSRLANRVLLVISRFPTVAAETLYQGVRAVDWADQDRKSTRLNSSH